MDKQVAYNNLKDAAEVLNELDCHWWLESGTCLGAVREGDFIDHDLDVDVGLTDRDKATEIVEKMRIRGHQVYKTYGTLRHGLEVAMIKNGVKTDFFWFYKYKDKLWHAAYQTMDGLKYYRKYSFDKDLFDKPKSYNFKGIQTYLPNPPEKYLEQMYGEWQTPVKDWSWWESPLCAGEVKVV